MQRLKYPSPSGCEEECKLEYAPDTRYRSVFKLYLFVAGKRPLVRKTLDDLSFKQTRTRMMEHREAHRWDDERNCHLVPLDVATERFRFEL